MRDLEVQYKKILSNYIIDQTERNLYIAQNFTRQLIQKNIAPEDVASMHKNAMGEFSRMHQKNYKLHMIF